MSKHILLTYTNGPWTGNTFTLDAITFARKVSSPDADLRDVPSAWMYAGLLSFNESGDVQLSPRGEDLLASIDSIPDDPAPEPTKPRPCSACNGTGEQALFVSKHVCDECGGSGRAKASVSSIVRQMECEAAQRARSRVCELVWRGLIPGAIVVDAQLGYHATIDSAGTTEAWHTDGMPEVGRHVEVEVVSGETLRGVVTDSDAATGLMLTGTAAAPMAYRVFDSWWTWQACWADGNENRVRWRYTD